MASYWSLLKSSKSHNGYLESKKKKKKKEIEGSQNPNIDTGRHITH